LSGAGANRSRRLLTPCVVQVVQHGFPPSAQVLHDTGLNTGTGAETVLAVPRPPSERQRKRAQEKGEAVENGSPVTVTRRRDTHGGISRRGTRRRCRIVNAPTGEISDLSPPRTMRCCPPPSGQRRIDMLLGCTSRSTYCQPARTAWAPALRNLEFVCDTWVHVPVSTLPRCGPQGQICVVRD
jgi:hypothetical protein